jgi:hypothetical protein
MDTNYKPNSHRSKEQKKNGEESKKLEKVISGNAIVKKKSGAHKLAEVFISEDAGSVKSYIWSDVFVPTIKKLFCDMIKDSADIVFGGGTRRNQSGIRSGYTSYDRFADRRDDRHYGISRSSGLDYDNIILETKGDAEEVLMQLDGVIEQYGHATVLDLFDLVGKTAPHTANRYGWTNLRNARSERVRDGYLLKLPRALPID